MESSQHVNEVTPSHDLDWKVLVQHHLPFFIIYNVETLERLRKNRAAVTEMSTRL